MSYELRVMRGLYSFSEKSNRKNNGLSRYNMAVENQKVRWKLQS